jgi:membrane protein
MSDSDRSKGGAVGDNWLVRACTALSGLLDVVPGARRTLTDLVKVEFLDRSMVIAAQALFSVTPLLVVFAAFAPPRFSSSILDQVTSLLGIEGNEAGALDTAATVQNVRTQTGVVGVILVVFSALSFARAIQRLYERVWDRRHRGGLIGYRRRLWWLIGWLTCLQLVSATVNGIAGSGSSLLRLTLQVIASTGLWWWTAHTLLLGGVPWRSLWLGALLTASGIGVIVEVSPDIMPRYVRASVEQFGGIGLMLAASTWLLALGGVVVMGAVLGRVLVEEPGLRSLHRRMRQLTGLEMSTHAKAPEPSEAE